MKVLLISTITLLLRQLFFVVVDLLFLLFSLSAAYAAMEALFFDLSVLCQICFFHFANAVAEASCDYAWSSAL